MIILRTISRASGILLFVFSVAYAAPGMEESGAQASSETGGEQSQTPAFEISPAILDEIKHLENKYPQKDVGAAKYQRSGHQHTSYIVAKLAGLGAERSHKLAFFSQFPDDEIKFSASRAFFYLDDITYRNRIMSTLHSLHGGDHDEVLKRRLILKQSISLGMSEGNLEDHQMGIIIHAFADSYAHVKERDSRLTAFGYVFGHLFHAHKPDIIAYAPERYKDYACNLYQALKISDSCLPKLNDLFAIIDKLAVTRDAELPKFEIYAKETLEFNEDAYKEWGAEWSKSVDRDEVVETINIMEKALQLK